MKLEGSGFSGFHEARDNQMGFLGFTKWVFFFFFFKFNMGFCFGGILVGSGQWRRGGHGGGAVVVTGQWRHGDRG